MKLDIDKVHSVIQSNPDLVNYYKWYLTHCLSLSLPYHNLNHTLGMMYHIICMCEKCKQFDCTYGFTIDNKDLYILLTSALFHDFNHSGGLYSDDINIRNAKDGLESCIREFLLDNETTDDIINICKDNISATQYPYIIPDSDLNLYQRILRECDILVSLYDDFFIHNIIGLYNEMRTKGGLNEFVADYMTFLKKSFMNMKLEYSKECYSEYGDMHVNFIKMFASMLV